MNKMRAGCTSPKQWKLKMDVVLAVAQADSVSTSLIPMFQGGRAQRNSKLSICKFK
jgi:hypothetical protein